MLAGQLSQLFQSRELDREVKAYRPTLLRMDSSNLLPLPLHSLLMHKGCGRALTSSGHLSIRFYFPFFPSVNHRLIHNGSKFFGRCFSMSMTYFTSFLSHAIEGLSQRFTLRKKQPSKWKKILSTPSSPIGLRFSSYDSKKEFLDVGIFPTPRSQSKSKKKGCHSTKNKNINQQKDFTRQLSELPPCIEHCFPCYYSTP